MSYKIFKLVKPDFLKNSEDDGYYIKTTERSILEEIKEGFTNKNEAINYLHENKENLKYNEYVILETFDINWDGEIR